MSNDRDQQVDELFSNPLKQVSDEDLFNELANRFTGCVLITECEFLGQAGNPIDTTLNMSCSLPHAVGLLEWAHADAKIRMMQQIYRRRGGDAEKG